MGCDIHVYIEYRNKNGHPNNKRSNCWFDFGGRINPGRNYALFTLMAGVRDYNHGIPNIVPRRGMPEDSSYSATNDSRIYITDNANEFSGERTVSMATAKKWVDSGVSKFIYSVHDVTDPRWVTNPDWHSHSWLTTNEFEDVLNKYLELESGWHKERVEEHNKYVKEMNIKPDSWAFVPPSMNIEPEYHSILVSMKKFEELGYEARIVFWFDN